CRCLDCKRTWERPQTRHRVRSGCRCSAKHQCVYEAVLFGGRQGGRKPPHAPHFRRETVERSQQGQCKSHDPAKYQPYMEVRRLDRSETGLFDPDGSAAVRQHLRSRRRRHVALARYLPRFVPNDFKMKSQYGQLADWPIEYRDLNSWYGEAEKELGVSADVD